MYLFWWAKLRKARLIGRRNPLVEKGIEMKKLRYGALKKVNKVLSCFLTAVE